MVKKVLKSVWIGLVALISIIVLVAGILVFKFSYILENMITGVKVEQTENVTKATLKEGQALADQIQGEGIVMTRNENNLLPLAADDKKVNVFGWAASQWLVGGSGSGTVKSMDKGFLEALDEYGVSYNQDIIDMYNDFAGKRPFETLSSYDYEGYRLYEPAIDNKDYYSDDMLKKAQDYSDTAFMVIGRFAGESSDAPKEQYKITEKEGEMVTDDSRTYLDFSQEEEELAKYLTANFEKVVLVVNSINTMSLREVETIKGLDGVLLVGATGTASATAIPEVIYGDITPSGKTTDTYAYDFATNASYANSGLDGVGAYTDAKGMYPMDGETVNGNVGNTKQLYEQVSFLDYVEDIYIGYRWYETADVEGYWRDIDNEFGKGYDGVVQYPFGYGLSYTDFKWEVGEVSPKPESNLTESDDIKVSVKVTNTGKVAGKDVVQLYYTPPYKKGEIEKASTNLAAFAKTKMLEPGESDVVELSVDARSMTSYDSYDKNNNQFVGYELDEGNYEVKVMKNAHEVADAENATITYQVDQNIQYPTDKVSGAEIKNIFTGEETVDGVSIDGTDSDSNIIYLSREDFKGTFPVENMKERKMTENLKDLNIYEAKAGKPAKEEKKEVKDDKDTLVFKDGKVTELGFALGENYDDPRWDDVINKMTTDEMEQLVLHGYTHTEKVESIGKPMRVDLDGPSQMGSFSVGEAGTGFPNATVVAQTWNEELAYDFGYVVGKQAGNLGVQGWYAPGVNIHRSPFGGRNYEYYSEDSLLSGVMAAKTIEGAKHTGVYTYLKHMVLYEQDSNRDSIYTWLTEQALREVYLKPYQYTIQEGEATGIMSSYNRLGAVWAGGSKALLTNLLRDEWGFEGSVITDYSDHHVFMNGDEAVRAGGDLWMDGVFGNGEFTGETESAEFTTALEKASKNIVYTWLNAEYTHKEFNATAETPYERPVVTKAFPVWKVIAGVLIAIVVVAWGFWIYRKVKKRKLVKEDNNSID